MRALVADRGRVRLITDGDELAARAVVVTAGAWSPGLLATAGIELPVVPTRETVVYLDVKYSGDVPPVIDYDGVPAAEEGGIARVGQAAYAIAAPGVGLKPASTTRGP